MFKKTRALMSAATLITLATGVIAISAARNPTPEPVSAATWVKFVASQRHVDIMPQGSSATWGGVSIQAKEIVWFGTSTLSRRLIVYFITPGSPDPGPQYNAAVHTGALFLPATEFSKWADLVYSGRTVYVRLDADAAHTHQVSTYNW